MLCCAATTLRSVQRGAESSDGDTAEYKCTKDARPSSRYCYYHGKMADPNIVCEPCWNDAEYGGAPCGTLQVTDHETGKILAQREVLL